MCIWHALRRVGVSYKKTFQHPKADPEKRELFCQTLRTYKEDGYPIVCLDESGFSHDMPRTYGYALRGVRCYGSHDWGVKGHTNVIGALFMGVLLTLSLFHTSINTEIFTQWIIQDLLPKLPPRCVIVMDNAIFHKGLEMQKAIQAAGHILLYLPPYSPEFNPIEHKWPQAKSLRRKTDCSIPQLFSDYPL